MNKTSFILALLMMISTFSDAQDLGPDFYKGRRAAFREMMPSNSVAVIFAASERLFANDVNYPFHQDPDFYYLTGCLEPNSALIIFKDNQKEEESTYNEILFIRERDSRVELFEGPRLGIEGAMASLKISHAKYSSEFKDFPIDIGSFEVVLYDDIPYDAQDLPGVYDMQDFYNDFIAKTGIVVDIGDKVLKQLHRRCKNNLSERNTAAMISYLRKYCQLYETVRNDDIIKRVMQNPGPEEIKKIKDDIVIQVDGVSTFQNITRTLREIKTDEELVLMRRAVEISCIAHNEVMKAANPSMSENTAHGIHLFVHKHYGSEDEGYGPIVGAGGNACILHYIKNDRKRLDSDLLLMDVGAQYKGYTADVTRTFPATGRFSKEQKAIYELVYAAQEEVFKICKAGTPFGELDDAARKLIAKGLIELGIAKTTAEANIYYPHGCSHYLGLDVHDKGLYGPLKANSIITVEPGIYIPEGSDCDPKWWSIGVRIEDDILIKDGGYENLSISSPRKWQEIEKLMSKKSVLTDFNPVGSIK